MKVVLELQDQPSNIRRITVRHDIVIGRGSDCNLRLSAPQVSRRHCFLRVSRDSASITDLDSSNGTFLDGNRIQSGRRYDLHDGISLALGPVKFLVQVRPDVVAAEVLQESVRTVNDSIHTSSPRRNRAGSTVIDSGAALLPENLRSGAAADDHALHDNARFSIEHTGDASDSRDVTADFAAADHHIPQAAELLADESSAAAHAQLAEDAVDVVEVLDEDEPRDEADVLDDVEVLNDVDVLNDVEVVELTEADLVDAVDCAFVGDGSEPVVELLDDASDSDWFTEKSE